MRTALRVLAGLNGAFQCIVGVLCVLAPAAAGSLFGIVSPTPVTLALTRMFGGLLAGSGLLSALLARDPDRNPDLPWLVAVTCVVNVASDVTVIANGELRFDQLAVGMGLQIVLAALAVAHARGRAAVA
jgi:hypothetical protein